MIHEIAFAQIEGQFPVWGSFFEDFEINNHFNGK